MSEVVTGTLAQVAAALRAKQVSSVELTRAVLARVDAAQGALNAFVTVDAEGALAQARAADAALAKGDAPPLAGVPIAHKDVIMTAGLRTTCGSRMLENFTAPFDAFVVEGLRNAGTVLIGKTNMDEFAMGSSNETSYFGTVKNPWNTDYVPGGSSGGSAAAVAARLVPGTTGTDTGGSIRQPASLSGICGMKPTYGVCSRYGLIAFASSLDTPGMFARTAEDCGLMLNAMAGHDARDSTSLDRPREDYTRDLTLPLQGLRIGLPAEYFGSGIDADVAAAVAAALAEFRKLGATTVDIALPNVNLSVPVYYVIAPAEASSNLSRFDGVRYGHRAEKYTDLMDMYKKSRAEGFGAEVKRRILVGTYVLSHGYYDAYYLKAQQVRRLIADDFARAYEKCDVIMGPTAPSPAFKFGAKTDDPVQMYLNDIFTIAGNLTGAPAISIPCGFDRRGLPIGLQIQGNYFTEAHLLRVAHQFQLASDWHRAPRSRERSGVMAAWEVVIGLETHAQLSTAAKIFSGASTAFGAAPNTQASAVDIALPGVLPVLNKGAVERAIRFGLAVGATINQRSVFARKNYFYPDLPKGYQISQYEIPVVAGGGLDIVSPTRGPIRIALTRAHLEEDAGKSLHEDFHGMSGIDLNRAGTPLLEIVTEPDMRSSDEAVAYAKQLHALVQWVGICDGNMQEGSFRCDANVSVRRAGEPLGTRCEIKNLNSFRFMQEAIDFEVRRQIALIEDGGRVVQETRLYDPDKHETRSMRSKEDAQDYRYFPDPDLPPLVIDKAWIKRVEESMPELPEAMKRRLVEQHGVTDYDATLLTASRGLVDYYEMTAKALQAGNAPAHKLVANWVLGEFSAALHKAELDIADAPVAAAQLAGLLKRVSDGTISGKIAKDVFDAMWAGEHGGEPDAIIAAKGLTQISDAGAIEKIVDDVIAANPAIVAEVKAGKEKAFNSLVGKVMAASKGKANPAQVNAILKQKLS